MYRSCSSCMSTLQVTKDKMFRNIDLALPTCTSCLTSKKECKYPQREKKVTLLESQLNKLQDKITFLESQLKNNNTNTTVNSIEMNTKYSSADSKNDCSIIESSSLIDQDNLHDANVSDTNIYKEEGSILFNLKLNGSSKHPYFGTSSGQVFDSELKSHLFEITQDSDRLLTEPRQSRHFFKDPSLESPFSGVVMLPDKEYALLLVDKVIKFLSHEYYLFDTQQFYIQIDEAYEKLRDKKPIWICYFLITLAVGEQYLSHSPNGEIPGMRFYTAAMRLYKSTYEEPTLEFVQTLILIAFYLQGLNSANAAFSFYGLAMRSALIQGLHRNIPFLSPVEKEKRKRLWWTIFIMDSIWCSNLGHPIHVQMDDIDVDFPEENYVDLNDGFNLELLGYSVKLASILCSVMKDVYCPTKGSTSIEVKKVLNCVQQLDQLQNIIPTRVQNNLIVSDNRSTANLYLRLNQYIVVTTRPLLLSLFKGHVQATDSIKHVVSRCVSAAILSIDILTNLKNNDWLSAFGFWDAQYCFSSLIILTICTFSGKYYPQTKTGREINTFMKDAGNFTAIDNEHRLIELDELLSKISLMSQQQFSNSDKLINGISQNPDLKPETTLDSEHEIIMGKRTNTIINENNTDTLDTNTITVLPTLIKDDSIDTNKENETSIPLFSPNSNTLFSQQSFNDFIEDMRNTYSGSVGDFTAFRNNLSPDTWNELTTNLQFWEPTNI
ncbi:hypothetical protein C6P40_002566 [Pichia californica]|uniref:Xylanolytic transcriptional activator regulatory domain-containing protein n=1 Tax=Pichia californica TaxID=460514 RepID=A0A9P6WK88_9ASCO|nr:hypothetical protein C6P42_002670 [[Candida] californica]KAG0687278.1 hypothetical protein C6P40_002566 [[Candida] californica]